ncbi:glycerate kinase [Arthrobacter crystallopoietes BAB-32]|uniref:Glycerate kinase n=1 Tax=Arthrobacter crystallopoietes BAB-32 TaxID=1246476 RepID=N1V2C0_9MICC|nr:glycerate kinase [Arthrobacter crystallopoietes BAB-32]
MKVLVAPDKFKGTLSGAEAAAAMAEGVLRVYPDAEVRTIPVADGGEEPWKQRSPPAPRSAPPGSAGRWRRKSRRPGRCSNAAVPGRP